jgi:hypothetical protein
LSNIQIVQKYITQDIKIICPVRNIVDILSSFISLCDSHPNNFIDKKLHTIDNEHRCEFLMKPGSMIDVCMNSFKTAVNKDYQHYFHFIEYDDLVFDTKKTLKTIYEFLDITYYEHDLNNICNYSNDSQIWNDEIYGMPLHTVRTKIEKKSVDPRLILPKDILNKYSNVEFWKQI